jgi:hypothetical protein
MQTKFNNGIRDRGLKQELRVGRKRALYEAIGQTHQLEVVKRAVLISIGLQEVSDWTSWRGRLPPKRKKGSPKHSSQKKKNMMAVHLDRFELYQGTARDERL